MNYFKLFELKEAPVIDKTTLARRYFELQKKFHPDFYTNENEAERENATMHSAEINKAFNIFCSPDKTLEYYLQQKGVIIPEEKYNLPSDFLMEVMELNESFDDNNIEFIQNNIAAFENKLYADVSSLLAQNTELNEEKMELLKAYFYKKKYLKRILERLDD